MYRPRRPLVIAPRAPVIVTASDGSERCQARIFRRDDSMLELLPIGGRRLPSFVDRDRTVIVDDSVAPFHLLIDSASATWARGTIVGSAVERGDTRASMRLRVARPATLEWGVATDQRSAEAFLVDLSRTGCAVSSTVKLAMGTAVRVQTRLSVNVVELTGEVTRVAVERRSYLHGIAFRDLAPHDSDAIAEYLERHRRDQGPTRSGA